MPFVTELIVSIVGGVITALILGLFSRSPAPSVQAEQSIAGPRAPKRRSPFGDLVRLILAVVGGFLVAMFIGRPLIQAGILPRGIPTRLGLLIAGTVLCWLILSIGRRI